MLIEYVHKEQQFEKTMNLRGSSNLSIKLLTDIRRAFSSCERHSRFGLAWNIPCKAFIDVAFTNCKKFFFNFIYKIRQSFIVTDNFVKFPQNSKRSWNRRYIMKLSYESCTWLCVLILTFPTQLSDHILFFYQEFFFLCGRGDKSMWHFPKWRIKLIS